MIEKEMLEAADRLEFERAAELHEQLKRLQASQDPATVTSVASGRSAQSGGADRPRNRRSVGRRRP